MDNWRWKWSGDSRLGCAHLPPVIADYVISLVHVELNVPPLTEGLTGQPQVAGPVVVMAMGENGTVQVTKILGRERVSNRLITHSLLPRTLSP